MMHAVSTNLRIKIKNILVPTDFSPISKASLTYAIALAKRFGAELCVAHVVEPALHYGSASQTLPVLPETDWIQAQKDLAGLVRSASFHGSSYETILQRGELWPRVAALLDTKKIDLLVTGSRGRKGLGRIVLGSGAEQIYRRAACPVLTVGPNVRPLDSSGWKLNRILFPTDGSQTSLKALPFALSLAEENNGVLIFLQLMPYTQPALRESEEAICRKELRCLLPAEAQDSCNSEFVVEFDTPAKGIVHLAQERNVDVIVMGVRRSLNTSEEDHLEWPTATRVIAESPCPVLTVRA